MIPRLLGVVAAMALAALSYGQAPTTRVMDCTNGGCHAAQKDHKFLHGPTAVGACDACHEYNDPVTHKFSFKREGRDLCEFCHIDKTGREGPVVHAPVAKGECSACHDPHGSQTKQLLKKDTVAQLCSECHKAALAGSHVHGPAATDCTACHKAHTADHKNLLTLEGRDLCVSCHEEVGKGIDNSKHPHPPAAKDCLACHSPHSSNNQAILKLPPKTLCASCHDKVAHTAVSATVQHSPVLEGQACLNCHSPHGSENSKLMKGDPVQACLACHKAPIKLADRTIPGVPEIAVAANFKHGPITQGECGGCHEVHGSEHTRLLAEPYSEKFAQPFTDAAYALCFKCHDKTLIMTEKSEKQTGFRDGERNLHFQHVVKLPQGRSCRSCHAVHASKTEDHIADTVPFGQWSLPINYKKEADGGSCAPGCHKPQRYARSGGATTPAAGLIPGAGGAEPPKEPLQK